MKLNMLFCFNLVSIGESFQAVALLSTRDFLGTISEARARAGSGRASLEVRGVTIVEAEVHRKNPRLQRDLMVFRFRSTLKELLDPNIWSMSSYRVSCRYWQPSLALLEMGLNRD